MTTQGGRTMREGPGQENLQLTMPELSSPCQFQFQFQHQLPPRARTTAPPAPPAAVSAAASPTPTPQLLLQQSIRMAQRRRLLTSPPFLLAASSAACLAGMALYFGYMHCAGSDQRAFSGVFVWPDDAEQSHYSWDAQTLQKGMVREGGTSKRLHASRGGDDDDDGSSTTSRGSASSYASSTSSNNNNNNNNNNGVASGGGGGGVTATTASSSGVDPMQLQNPSFYGWVPDWYPNPLVDPIRCSIAYLSTTGIAAALNNAPATTTSTSVAGQPNYPTSPSDDDSYDSADDTTDDDDGAVNEPVPQTPPLGNDSTNASRAGGASPPLPPAVLAAPTRGGPTPVRLCDPDWVLGTDYLEEIAMALSNFSRTFGRPDWAWRLQQQHSQSQSSSAVHYAHAPSRYRLHPPPDRSNTGERSLPTTVELGVATVRKINLAAVLREGSYFAYEDEDDMVNDAAQIFARTLHDAWWDNSNNNADPYAGPPSSSNNARRNGILVFLSIQDRVCFISTGSELASLLPWWRLDHIVASMKPDLQHREYGTAVLRAIDTVALLLQSGPPTWRDRLTDFVARFGVVLGFAAFTFCFGAWGEYRDRRKRWQYAEQRSQLSGMDRDKARQLQREYKTRSCPICLENLEYDGSNGDDNEDHEGEGVHTGGEYSDDDPGNDKTLRCTEADQLLRPSEGCSKLRLRRVDSYGIPLRGADHRPLKLLRCGHVFCESCWKSWVHSGYGNPCNCPVCRQDVGRAPRKRGATQSRRAGVASAPQPASSSSSSSTPHSHHRHHPSSVEDGAGPGSTSAATTSTDGSHSDNREPNSSSSSSSSAAEVNAAIPRMALTHPSYDAVSRSRRNYLLPNNTVTSTSLLTSLFQSRESVAHRLERGENSGGSSCSESSPLLALASPTREDLPTVSHTIGNNRRSSSVGDPEESSVSLTSSSTSV